MSDLSRPWRLLGLIMSQIYICGPYENISSPQNNSSNNSWNDMTVASDSGQLLTGSSTA
jgi:hypothetical protein